MKKKYLSLKDKQDVSLYLLKKLHAFCEDNDIHYSLAYGTLIGAVRHKGFIPWDDDIDVLMLRPDFDRFCASFKMEGLSLHCHQNDPGCFIGFARICDDVYTRSIKNSWLCGGGYTGMWIDVFPVDSVEDDPDEYLAHYYKMQELHTGTYKYRARLNGIYKTNNFKANVLASILKLWPFHQIYKKKAVQYMDNFIKEIKRIPFGTTGHYSQLAIPGTGSKNYLKTEYFDDFVLLDFEGLKFYAMKDYDTDLRLAFGDYMQLPPEDQRTPLHEFQFFYWKKEMPEDLRNKLRTE